MAFFLVLMMMLAPSSFSMLTTRLCGRLAAMKIPQKRVFSLKSTTASSTTTWTSKNNSNNNNNTKLLPKAFFVLGGPGSGKGTQCELLSQDYGMIHLSAGELLRLERLSGSENGNLIESYLTEGKIVPVEITLQLLQESIVASSSTRFLIDGFPRNWDNLQGWQRRMESICDIDAVLFFECPENILEGRLLSRGLTSGRSDDNVETIRKRFKTFHESTMPIINYFEEKNKVIRISGKESRAEVNEKLVSLILPFVKSDVINAQRQLESSIQLQNWSDIRKQFLHSNSSFDIFALKNHRVTNPKCSPVLPSQVHVVGQKASIQADNEVWKWVLEDGQWKLHELSIGD